MTVPLIQGAAAPRLLRRLGATMLAVSALFLSACAPGIPVATRADGRLTDVQACAIGWDMARTIHHSVALRETVLVAPARPNTCEEQTVRYLRLAGFAVDESGQGQASRALVIDVTNEAEGATTVVATVAGNLRIARQYRLAATGVYAASAPSIVQLPSQYRRKAASASIERVDR